MERAEPKVKVGIARQKGIGSRQVSIVRLMARVETRVKVRYTAPQP